MKINNGKGNVRLASGVVALCLNTLLPLVSQAQGQWIVKGDCTPDATGSATTRGLRHGLPPLRREWDADKLYRQLVVLLSFSDRDFADADPQAAYTQMLNAPGYNERNGAGSAADYFREQSGGLFNVQFDVYGPYKVDSQANPYTNPDKSTRNYGKQQFKDALQLLFNQHPDMDYSQYDWDGNGTIEQVMFVYAGVSGNQGEESYGHIWPNTGTMSTVVTPGDLRITSYTASGECWINANGSCGIGTICHEYSHSLGLPDIYPTVSGAGYSVVDEWDLMDGGNYTNYGWCPPNYTPLEKMLLGWLTPIELTEAMSISGLKPIADGGEVYQVKKTDTDYYLIENRQWRGWDYGTPGQGLVIYHVDYDASAWSGNTVNNNASHRRFELLHADGLDYDAWDALLHELSEQAETPYAIYKMKSHLRNTYLSTSPFPWSTDSTETVDSVTLDAGKRLTNIRITTDGLAAFDFMGGTPTAMAGLPAAPAAAHAWYDLQGRRLQGRPSRGVYISGGKKIIIR